MSALQHAHLLMSALHPQPHEKALVEVTGLMPKTKPVKRYFTRTDVAAECSVELNDVGYSTFVNVNPRDKFSSFEVDVPYVTALALDLQTTRMNIQSVDLQLMNAKIPPSITAVSGAGYHYYLLVEPCAKRDRAKAVWERLCKWTSSDPIFSLNRIMRVAGRNWKYNPPAWCYLTGVDLSRRYTIDFVDAQLTAAHAPDPRDAFKDLPVATIPDLDMVEIRKKLAGIAGGEGVLDILKTGDRNPLSEKQISRSEADWAVICALVRIGCTDEMIFSIYVNEPVRLLKFYQAGPRYLQRTIESARRETGEARPRGGTVARGSVPSHYYGSQPQPHDWSRK